MLGYPTSQCVAFFLLLTPSPRHRRLVSTHPTPLPAFRRYRPFVGTKKTAHVMGLFLAQMYSRICSWNHHLWKWWFCSGHNQMTVSIFILSRSGTFWEVQFQKNRMVTQHWNRSQTRRHLFEHRKKPLPTLWKTFVIMKTRKIDTFWELRKATDASAAVHVKW